MRAKINSKGAFVIEDITEKALQYIESCPAKEYFEQLGKTVYVNAPFMGDKETLMGAIQHLAILYRMDLSGGVGYVLKCWSCEGIRVRAEERKVAGNEKASQWVSKEMDLLRQKAELAEKYKRLIVQGCKGCEHFHAERFGDDCLGYCCVNETRPVRLDESHLSFQYGEYVNGIQYMGTKHYPHNECKYLKEDRK